MSAIVRREKDGIFFGGDTGGSAPAGMASGGGGGGLEDVRWNDEEYRLEKSDGGAWQTVLQFVEFDA